MTRRSRFPHLPPRGWNSWDCYGPSIDERETLAAADALSRHLLGFGWQYLVIDGGWYGCPEATLISTTSEQFPLRYDDFCRLLPAPDRFPSAAGDAGFGPLAAAVHERGLKFGIHIMRGIPRAAVWENLPIWGTAHRARDIADRSSTCSWNALMYGVNVNHPAAQAYYDSLLSLYADWGVDFIKADDLGEPFAEGEVKAIRTAIERCGRPILLSLSPGPAVPDLSLIPTLLDQTDLFRISPDLWDSWQSQHPHLAAVSEQFARCQAWARFAGPGHWPDADMLCIGRLGPRPPHGADRLTALTGPEQQTLVTLLCMARSPLMFGGDPCSLDPSTLRLLTNDEVLAVHHGAGELAVRRSDEQLIIWSAKADEHGGKYVAVFNLMDCPMHAALGADDLGFAIGTQLDVRDLWARQNLPNDEPLQAQIPAHGALLAFVQHRRSG